MVHAESLERPTLEKPPTRRILQLDILRGLAILLVLGRHSAISYEVSGWARPLAMTWDRFGWTGVDLFFVLSGFLIGGLIFGEIRARHRFDIRRFFVRRAFKILPLYYVYLVIAAVALKLKIGGAPFYYLRTIARSLVVGAVNLQNYLGTPYFHTWSLAVEEHFYLLLPLLLWLFALRGRASGSRIESLRCVPILAMLAIFVCTSIRLWDLRNRDFNIFKDQIPSHIRMDGLLFGVWLAYLYHFQPKLRTISGPIRLGLLLVGLGLVTPMMFLDLERSWFVPTWGFAFLYVGYGLILWAFVTTPVASGSGLVGRLMTSGPGRLIAIVGFYSYPIYLFHLDLVREPLLLVFPPGPVAWGDAGLRWCLGMVLFLVFSSIVGIAFNRLIEKPTLALRERFFPPEPTVKVETPATTLA